MSSTYQPKTKSTKIAGQRKPKKRKKNAVSTVAKTRLPKKTGSCVPSAIDGVAVSDSYIIPVVENLADEIEKITIDRIKYELMLIGTRAMRASDRIAALNSLAEIMGEKKKQNGDTIIMTYEQRLQLILSPRETSLTVEAIETKAKEENQ